MLNLSKNGGAMTDRDVRSPVGDVDHSGSEADDRDERDEPVEPATPHSTPEDDEDDNLSDPEEEDDKDPGIEASYITVHTYIHT